MTVKAAALRPGFAWCTRLLLPCKHDAFLQLAVGWQPQQHCTNEGHTSSSFVGCSKWAMSCSGSRTWQGLRLVTQLQVVTIVKLGKARSRRQHAGCSVLVFAALLSWGGGVGAVRLGRWSWGGTGGPDTRSASPIDCATSDAISKPLKTTKGRMAHRATGRQQSMMSLIRRSLLMRFLGAWVRMVCRLKL
jgi:hypothetical protein